MVLGCRTGSTPITVCKLRPGGGARKVASIQPPAISTLDRLGDYRLRDAANNQREGLPDCAGLRGAGAAALLRCKVLDELDGGEPP